MKGRGWSGRENAEAYDRFARTYRMYRETSADLVRIAEIGPGETVVDLGCGTGVTTEAVLTAVGGDGRVIGVEASPDMLAVAEARVRGPNVTFVRWPAGSFHLAVEGPVDAVVCNSAFWQMDAVQVLSSAREVLGDGGRVAFDLGSQFVRLEENLGPHPDFRALDRALTEAAARRYGYTPPGRRFGPLETPDRAWWEEQVAAGGFEVVRAEVVAYEQTAEEIYAWLRIPVFAGRLLPDLPYGLKMEVLEEVFFDVVDPDVTYGNAWLHVIAEPSTRAS